MKNYAKTRINNRELEIWFSPNDKFLAEINLQRFDDKKIYAISLGGGFKNKHWKAENFAKLINMILKNESATFAIFGGPSEIADAEIIKSIVDEQFIIDFTGKFNYRQSMALLNLCDCYIGNDTGLMHAATALKIPVLTPNCFANDIEMTPASSLQRYHPYKVPSVVVRPKHALPECQNSTSSERIITGCTAEEPHCINQITPEKMFEGLQLLNKQIAKNAKEPLFLC